MKISTDCFLDFPYVAAITIQNKRKEKVKIYSNIFYLGPVCGQHS
jgi:hypothetical protein